VAAADQSSVLIILAVDRRFCC